MKMEAPPDSAGLVHGVCYFDTDLRYRSINDWLAAINGLKPADHVGREIGEILPSVAESVRRQLRHVIETGEAILNGLAYSETAAHPGATRLYQHDYYPDKSADGTVQGVRWIVRDITPQKLTAVAGVIPWEADATTWEFSYVGPQAVEMLGYPIERWYERGFWAECIHPDDREFVIDFCRSSSVTCKDYEFEYRMLRADGGVLWLRDVVSVESVDGRPIILRGFMFDVSDLKNAQQQVELSSRQLAAFLESAPDASILVRTDGTILFASDQVKAAFGYEPEELVDSLLEKLIPERFRLSHRAHVGSFIENPSRRPMGGGRTLFAIRKDGTEFPVEISLGSVDSDGEVVISAAIRDVTEKIAADELLHEVVAEVEQLRQQLQAENLYLRNELGDSRADDLVGESGPIRQVKSLISQVAPTDATVLIQGETGTGKELVARGVHMQSARADKPFIRVNCSTLPSALIESELFGHVRGAYTGAVNNHVGRFGLADGGTIFLDEIGDLPIELQPKLLRVLQEGEFEPLGSTETTTADVRVVAATNRDLEQAVAQNQFRRDLFYRLQVFPIHVPPLRYRATDIPMLVWFLLSRSRLKSGRPITSVPEDVMDRLVDYPWPGNVRELQNVIERALILTRGSVLELPPSFGGSVGAPGGPNPANGGHTRLQDVERAHILRVLEDCGWVIKGESNAAAQLGLHPSTLTNRMKKLGIKRPESVR